jgi:cobalt-zinc-cadmium efflux system membrane fusion protein
MYETTNNVNVLESSALPRPQEPSPTPGPATSWSGGEKRVFAWLGRVLPNLLVLLTLGGLAFWGHHTGWKVPRFSELTGAGGKDNDDWCPEHTVPESQCVECNPGLLPKPKAYGWCATHGVHDCPLEHPEVAQLTPAPPITSAIRQRVRRALDFAGREENSKKCKLHPRRIQFASQAALDRMGIELEAAWESPVEESVAASGEVGYDPARVAHLSSPVPGKVWRVEEGGDLGHPVRKGEVLALIDAAEVGKAKTEFLQAVAQVELKAETLEGLRAPYSRGAIPEGKFREARAALREAQIRLVGAQQTLTNLGLPITGEDLTGLAPAEVGRRVQFLGLPENVAKALDPKKTTTNLFPVKAPFDGEVVSRPAVTGEVVTASQTLFVVADPRRMWLTLHLRPDSLKPFRQKNWRLLLAGKPVRFVPDGMQEEVTGTVTWISTAVDEKTRTLRVRAELTNPDGKLQANTFGTGRVVLREEKQAVTVPSDAIHWEGGCHVVFVWDKNSSRKDAPKVFHVRTVRPGVRNGPSTEIIAGVLPGEMVATRNSGVLRAELLKNRLGEG